ncbi:phage tail protein I [Brevibacillus brevis]|uniref:phage tail protein I n=1 Tax=Brevibacillus brevis TaxID=1393 RepID=UPI001C8D7460|nr:phage tail protein I [Brevibacillus brevis]MBY0088401.1 phage tail protein I [Brevibacillus brevis]
MIDIFSGSLLDILPESLKRDPDSVFIAEAIAPEFQETSKAIKLTEIMSRIDEHPEEVIDLLAWQFHVDFYDPELPLETRRELVKNSLTWHRRKGTPAAVEELISTVFGDGRVEEWFEYGGQPGYFKVITNNRDVTTEQALMFTRALNSVKNTRSWLEKIEISQVEEHNLYFAGIIHMGDKITVKQVT